MSRYNYLILTLFFLAVTLSQDTINMTNSNDSLNNEVDLIARKAASL